ncbi:hypothetical protein SAMN02910358_00277 [Lachnospiraceae bacterium XBB1006]|nr:hypothetical protein SAMN02910358_00277 [Lachnospiraceae bacterium XBB1006]
MEFFSFFYIQYMQLFCVMVHKYLTEAVKQYKILLLKLYIVVSQIAIIDM